MIKSAALALSITCLPLAAQACEFGYCWGALGFGPDGAVGQSVRQNTAPDADSAVRTACSDNCTIVEVFNDTCASLAAAPDGTGYMGVGDNQLEASENAQNSCLALHSYCITRVSACSVQ